MPEVTDNELIAKSLQGNQKAFSELVRRHHGTAYAVVRGILGDSDDVDDVLQTVYIKVYRGLGGFRGDARFSTWIYQIARNESINAVKKRRLDTSPIDDVVVVAPAHNGPEATAHRAQLGEMVASGMQRLDEPLRMALELRYMGERSYEEIAEIMEIPIGTVKTYIHRGKLKLKQALARHKQALE